MRATTYPSLTAVMLLELGLVLLLPNHPEEKVTLLWN